MQVGANNDSVEKALDYVNSVLSKGCNFIDEEFPPTGESLYKEGDYGNQTLQNWWRRASEIYEDPNVFKDGVDYRDIKQGCLQNTSFLAALASAAEVP